MLRAKLLSRPHVALTTVASSLPLVGKGLGLFAYVATQPEPCLRTKLLDLLWGDVSERKAQEYLRSLLYSVRQSIGDYLLVNRQTVEFNRSLPYWLDVEVFAGAPPVRVKQDAVLLAESLNLYQCEFLDGLQLSNAPVFDSWLQEERRCLRDHAIAGWQKLANYYWAQQDYQMGIAANLRLLELAPWHEEAHRQQMRFLVAAGQRSAALAQYELCCRNLRDELDAPPSEATTALYEQIKAPAGAQASEQPGKLPLSGACDAPAAPGLRTCLSLGTMPRPHWFVGRQSELQTLYRWVVGERCRAVSILGSGGLGKTTLAASFVQILAEPGQDGQPAFEGIVWHTVHYAPQPEQIISDWLRLLSDDPCLVVPSTRDRQIDLLREYLQRRRFLFVLDNAESIVAAMDDDRREEYSTYTQIWRLFAESNHQSCVLITARTWVAQLRNQYEQIGSYRRLVLEGLPPEDSIKLLKKHGLHGADQELAGLQHAYCGNPLALELVAHTIDELYDGDVHAFVDEELPLLGEVELILRREYAGLSPLEQELFTWLSLVQKPISSAQLWDCLLVRPAKREYLMALNSLVQHSLIHQQEACYSVENVLGEYARHRLVDEICLEVASNPPLSPVHSLQLNRYRLCDALGSQPAAGGRRDLLVALSKRLLCHAGGQQVMQRLDYLLAAWRSEQEQRTEWSEGYAEDNLLQLQSEIRCAMRP